jgi:hypothetical protein
LTSQFDDFRWFRDIHCKPFRPIHKYSTYSGALILSDTQSQCSSCSLMIGIPGTRRVGLQRPTTPSQACHATRLQPPITSNTSPIPPQPQTHMAFYHRLQPNGLILLIHYISLPVSSSATALAYGYLNRTKPSPRGTTLDKSSAIFSLATSDDASRSLRRLINRNDAQYALQSLKVMPVVGMGM